MKKSINLLMLSVLMVTQLNSQNISTIAGTGTSGSSGDGGQATAAQFGSPRGVITDATGNIYMVDAPNNTIRMINTSGVVSTFAGTGVLGFFGDGGLAVNAKFNMPMDIALDNTGAYLYVADNGNNRIRRIHVSTGTITTICGTGVAASSGDGGLATAAGINSPNALDFDATGNLYVVMTNASAVRVISTSSIITKFAGTYGPTSPFSGDGGLAVSAGINSPYDVHVIGTSVYIVENGSNRIRVVNSSGVINTFAGGGASLGDGGLATSAQFFQPTRMTHDIAGNIYIADYGQNRIRKINTLGVISTIVGTGSAGSTGDGGLATSALINNPSDVTIDINGNLMVSDMGNHKIRKVCLAPSTLNVVGTKTICSGSSTTLTASGSSSYLWNTSASTTSIVVSPSNTTVYTTTGTTAGCASTINTTVTVKVTPTITVIGNITICDGATTTFSVSGASNYTWSTASNATSIAVSPTTNITYSVSGTTNGCSSSTVVNVVVNQLPALTFNSFGFSDTVCVNGTTVALTGASPSGGNYSGTGIATNVFNPNVAGTGTFNVVYSYTNTSGCSSSISRIVKVVSCSTTTTSIDENTDGVTIGLYPNPASSMLTIDTDYEILNVAVFSITGQQVLTSTTNKFDVSSIPAGAYYLQAVTAKGSSKSAKFIKQ